MLARRFPPRRAFEARARPLKVASDDKPVGGIARLAIDRCGDAMEEGAMRGRLFRFSQIGRPSPR